MKTDDGVTRRRNALGRCKGIARISAKRKATLPPWQRSTLAPMSEKRYAAELLYRKAVRLARKRAAGRCELRVEGVCVDTDPRRRVKLEPHEPRTKARFGLPSSPDAIRITCRPCHDFCHHVDPIEATRLGHLVPRNKGRAVA